MRKIWLAFFLAGCVPLTEGQVRNSNGNPVDNAYVAFNPLCLFFCNSNLATSGSDVDTIGQGASGSNSQTQTLNADQSGGKN